MKKTENKLQQEIVMYFTNKYCLKHHNPRLMIMSVPNDSMNVLETKRKINTGLLPGASDLIVFLENKILFIEVKTEIGIQSAVQKDFQSRIEQLGHEYHLIRSLNEFCNLIVINNNIL